MIRHFEKTLPSFSGKKEKTAFLVSGTLPEASGAHQLACIPFIASHPPLLVAPMLSFCNVQMPGFRLGCTRTPLGTPGFGHGGGGIGQVLGGEGTSS